MSKDFLPEVVFCLLFVLIIVIKFKEYKIGKNHEVNIKGHTLLYP